jgi:hypothetical protein
MVVTENVQGAMDYQPEQLFANAHALTLRVFASDIRTNVDVSDNGTALPGSLKAEGDDVRRTLMVQITAVQLGHRYPPDERDRQHRIPHTLRLQRSDGRFFHQRTRNRGPPHAG